MLKNALESLLAQTSKNFKVAFIDDGSKKHGRPIVEKMIGDSVEVSFYRSNKTTEQKINGDIEVGRLLNQAIDEATDCKVIQPLNDDDALFPNAIELLEEYYGANPTVQASWSYFKDWYPYTWDYKSALGLTSICGAYVNDSEYESYGTKILDRYDWTCPQAQLTWRRSLDLRWPEDRIVSMDAVLVPRLIYKLNGIPPCNQLMIYLYGNHRGSIGGRAKISTEDSIRFPLDMPDGFIPHANRLQ
jgi:glycosyltransferase involved in cell wall biosynthesis